MAPLTLRENTFTHSGDKTTFYWSAGPSEGPLVIFIHGWPGNGETWKPQLLALAALGFHTVAPDTRGYGRSSVPASPSDYALEHHVSDMLALLTHLRRSQAVWIGHDWGALLVGGFAAQRPQNCVAAAFLAVPYKMLNLGLAGEVALSNRTIYPEDQYPYAQWDYQAFHVEQPEASAAQLSANVLGSVKVFFRAATSESYGKPSFLASIRKNGGWWGGLPSAPDLPYEKTLFAQRDDKDAFDRMVAEFEKNGFEGPNAYYLNHDANQKYLEGAPNGGRLTYPVLFVHAKWDGVCDTSLSNLCEPMRESCEDLTEVTIDAGHWVGLEASEETNAALVRWIATKVPTYFPGYWKTPFVSKV
ncbi:unnamed protein product [Discula destructiva]